MSRTLVSLPQDVLYTLCAHTPTDQLRALVQTHSALYTAGTPLLLRHISLRTSAHISSLALLLSRHPYYASAVHTLRIGPRDINTYRDDEDELADILEKTTNLRALELEQAERFLGRHPGAAKAIFSYASLGALCLTAPNDVGASPAEHMHALLCAIRAPLRRLVLVHTSHPALLAALIPFTDSLEELSITGVHLSTCVPPHTTYPRVHKLALKDCTFPARSLVRLFPSVAILDIYAGGLPYGTSPAPDVPTDDDVEEPAWPTLHTLRADIYALSHLPPTARPHTLDLTRSAVGSAHDTALLGPALEVLQPRELRVAVGRGPTRGFWEGVGRAVGKGQEGGKGEMVLGVEVAWVQGWREGELFEYLMRLPPMLAALPVHTLSVEVARWGPTKPPPRVRRPAGGRDGAPATAGGQVCSLLPRDAYARLCEQTRKCMPQVKSFAVRWEAVGWMDEIGPLSLRAASTN